MTDMTIGQLAKRSGVHIQTIRYYERRGLLEKPDRSAGGYRHYPLAVVRRIRFIKRAQALGFTLTEIQDLLALWEEPTRACDDVRDRAQAKVADIDRKIKDLETVRQALAELVSQCVGGGMDQACPILDALDPPAE